MPHTCEHCGETFKSLSKLRLHDCPDDQDAIERERQKEDEEFDAMIPRPLSSTKRGYDPDSSDHWDWETLHPEFDDAGFD